MTAPRTRARGSTTPFSPSAGHRADPGQISVSPLSIRTAATPARLVLPSPERLDHRRAHGQARSVCVGACLRNAAAVAAWIGARHDPAATTVALVAAGERWDDGSLRPSIEDLWGAGAVIARLATAGWARLSPEAHLARAGYEAIRGRERDALIACASGRELVEAGYRTDVEIAAEIDLSDAVPLLVDGRLRAVDWRV